MFSGLRRPDEINTLIPGLEVEESPEYETVGGFMMERLGRIPEVGDSVPVPGGTLRVDTLEGRRVDRIRFTPAPSAQEQTEKGGERMNDWVAIVLLIILLAGNAFFVAGEFAIMSTRRAQIEPLAEEGNKRAQTVIYALENVSLMLATCQLGITICSLLILNVSEPALHHMLEVPLHLVGLPHAIVDVIAFGITLILVTYLHVIFGEMVPKNAAVTLATRGVALWIVPPLVTISKIFAPVVALLNNLSNKLLALMKVEAKDEVASTFTLGELQTIVATSTAEGTVEDDAGVIESALEFTEKDVYEIMVPGDKLVTLPFGSTPAELERAVARSGYSRFVIVDSDGTYMGYLHVKDALAIASERSTSPSPGTSCVPWTRSPRPPILMTRSPPCSVAEPISRRLWMSMA